jgi:imidazolonepropionase-like amidohydrolase
VLSALEAEGLCDADETWATRSELDCTGEHIAPGFVDAHVHLGLYPEGFVGEPKDLNELTSPLTPQLRAMDGIWPGDVAFKKAREAGVTTVCVIPGSANVVGGVGVVLKTSGVDVERMSLREPACLKIAFGYNVKHNHGVKGRAPLTRMAIVDMMRTAFEGALAYEERRLKDPNTPLERGKEHLLSALKRELPVRAHASRSDDILSAVRLAREFGFKLIIEHGYEAVQVIEQLKEVGAAVVYGPAFRTCGHSEDLNFSFSHAQTLLKAGLEVAHMTDHPIVPVQYLPLQAGLCVREGLAPDEALKLVTSTPARLLGVAERVGQLKQGLDADIVRLSGPPLSVETRVIAAYINGAQVN